ncbi:MAG: 3-hydroxyacyl-CoA dehydrogenase family protein [Deltaproteobacteria bacterium]|nr:3-hydroxyacyl-CoA dehydrogenase family protein [Deltaproteobacteria bacterium]
MARIMVVGAGFMGAGIAQVAAQVGHEVALVEVSPSALERALGGMASSVAKLAAKGLVAEDPAAVLARVSPARDLAGAAQAAWVVEAVPEREELKLELFRELSRLAPTGTPLASNTSSIPIGRLAAAVEHPERVLGLHFFGPVPLMGLVEVVKGPQTADEVFARGVEFVRGLGKTPVQVTQDIPGFVMNRVFAAAFREAVDLVARGVATPADVDAGMRLGYGWGAGPFEIADNAGLDTVALISRFMAGVGETELAPHSDLLERMVAQGRLGRKVGKGFYNYTPEGKRQPWDPKAVEGTKV